MRVVQCSRWRFGRETTRSGHKSRSLTEPYPAIGQRINWMMTRDNTALPRGTRDVADRIREQCLGTRLQAAPTAAGGVPSRQALRAGSNWPLPSRTAVVTTFSRSVVTSCTGVGPSTGSSPGFDSRGGPFHKPEAASVFTVASSVNLGQPPRGSSPRWRLPRVVCPDGALDDSGRGFKSRLSSYLGQ